MPRPGLDGCGKSRPHRNSIPEPSSRYTDYTIPGPPRIKFNTEMSGGTGWQDLRHKPEFTGSFHDGVTRLFKDLILSAALHQEYFLGGNGGRCIWLTTLPPSCADCLVILGASTSWSPKDLSRPV
jgi:hypothetical protein